MKPRATKILTMLTVLALMLSLAGIATSSTGQVSQIYGTYNGETVMFELSEIIDAYGQGYEGYQEVWEATEKESYTVGDKNVSWDEFISAYVNNPDVSGPVDYALLEDAVIVDKPFEVYTVDQDGNLVGPITNPYAVKQVVAVADVDDVNVDYGTAKADAIAALPAEVDVTLNDNSTTSVSVTWDSDDYDAETPGTYTFTGTLQMPEGIVNPDNLTATANVIVGEAPDTEAPVVSGVEDGAVYNVDVTPVCEEDGVTVTLTKDGEAVADYALGTAITEDGAYVLTVADAAGNETVVSFTIDKTAPAVDAENSGVTDYQTLTVAFTEAVTGTPEVTVVKGSAVSVDSAVLAEDGMSLVITKDAGFSAGTFTVTVNGLADAAGNAMEDAGVEITKDSSYIASFGQVTTLLPNSADQKVKFTVADQYGQDITSSIDTYDNNLEVSAVYKDNNFPLAASYAQGSAAVAIADTLTAGKIVVVTITNSRNVEGEADPTATFEVTVQEPGEGGLVPTSISSISAESSTIEAGVDNVTLTALVKDQLGNAYEIADDYVLRWTTSDQTIVAFDTGNMTAYDADSDADFDNNTYKTVSSKVIDVKGCDAEVKVKALAPGTATITVYLPDGTAVDTPLTVTVTEGELAIIGDDNADLTGDDAVENKATVEEANVLVNPTTEQINDGANYITFKNAQNGTLSVPASLVTFDIVDGNNEDASSVVNIEKVEDANGNLAGLIITTDRPDQETEAVEGNPTVQYTVTVNVGDEASSGFNVDSKINTTVTAIDDITIGEQELTAGGNVVKPIVFRNKYNEVIEVTDNADNNVLVGTAPAGITIVAASDEEGTTAGAGDAITHIKISASASTEAGTYSGMLVIGSISKALSIPVVGAAEVASIELGSSSVSVIAGDTLDAETPDEEDMTLVVGGKTYTAVPVTFKDQYGNVMTVKGSNVTGYDLKATATTDANSNDPEVIFLDALADGTDPVTVGSAAEDEDVEIKYIAVAAEQEDDVSKTMEIEIWKDADYNADNVLASATIDVDVQDARQLATLTATPASASIVVGASKTFVIDGIDQYGREFTIDHNMVDVVAAPANEYGDSVTDGDNANEAKVTITGNTAGSYNAVVFYDEIEPDQNAQNADEVTVTIPLTIGEIGQAIDSVVIDETADVDPSGDENFSDVDLATYKAKVTADASNTVTFTANAYDASGNEVGVSSSDIIWSVVNNSLVEGSDGSVAASFSGNVLTIDASDEGDSGEISGTITVKATALNGKYDEMTVNVSSDAPAALSGSYYVTTTDDQDTALEEITIDDTEDGIEEFNLFAVDQYGQKFNVTENDNSIVIGRDSSSFFTVEQDGDSIIINTKKAGTTNMRIFVDGNQEVVIPVTVTEDAAAVAPVVHSATATVGGEDVTVDVVNGEGQVDLSAKADDDYFTELTINASVDSNVAELTLAGIDFQVAFSNGVATLNVSEELGDLDTGEPGISMQYLRQEATGGQYTIEGTVTDFSGVETTVTVDLVVEAV